MHLTSKIDIGFSLLTTEFPPHPCQAADSNLKNQLIYPCHIYRQIGGLLPHIMLKGVLQSVSSIHHYNFTRDKFSIQQKSQSAGDTLRVTDHFQRSFVAHTLFKRFVLI